MFECLFTQNKKNPNFKAKNVWLYDELTIKDNPYNIVPIYHIHFGHLNAQQRKRHFLKIIYAFRFISYSIKEYILKRFYLFFLGCYW